MLDGTINRDAFVAYIRHVQVLELAPRDIVIMFNQLSHKAPGARETIEAAGATAQGAELIIHGLWDAIGRIFDPYPPPDCASYFANAGYDAD